MTTAQQNRELHAHMRYLKRAMAAGLMPPKKALHRPRYCGCGERVTGATHGVTRHEYGTDILWQANCGCGSTVTVHHNDYRRGE